MLRVLIINHYWPPTGGACVQRWVDFSSSLAANGFDITVLTPSNPGFPNNDESLINRVDDRVKVVKIKYRNIVSKARKAIGGSSFSLFIRGNFFLPDPRINWNRNAIKYINNHINEFDLIITAGPPHSTHFIGYHFRKQKKWIADFHDYWTEALYINLFHRNKLTRIIDKYLERKILRNADCIFAHCEKAKQEYSKITNRNIHIIPMGFFDEYFIDEDPPVEYKTISHIGSFFPDYREALVIIKEYCSKGYTFRQIGPVIGDVKFPKESKIIPYLEHKKAIEFMRKSEVLLLVNHEKFLPGKIFEYIASMRKIELISPIGTDAEKLITDNEFRDKELIFKDYSRNNIAMRIAKIIEDLDRS